MNASSTPSGGLQPAPANPVRAHSTAIEIDALELRAVKRRFNALNRDRLRRVQASLEAHQRVFLDLLPLLFHINHPMLPGYLNRKTPCGISDYSPAKRHLLAARQLTRSFNHRRRAQRRYSIHALYLMGSTGTIAYTSKSDFDIWICLRPGLSDDELHALREKAEDVRSWAESLGLEVHFFLMDEAVFRRREHQQLSNENAGSTQHHLLLDEFYRTSLLIAGRYPVWWLVPAACESRYEEYVQKLIVNRFIKATDIVDFGGLHDLAVDEFHGATLWQLHKAVDSPYKSILKILLMEAYANQYPDIEMLSLRFKKRVHAGEVSIDQLDPYVMMCQSVEEYLFERRELDRLDLVRRCLYFKVNQPLGTERRGGGWRREVLRTLVKAWGWGQVKLRSLDQRARWKYRQVLEERNRLVDELTRSYRTLSRFQKGSAGARHPLDQDELKLLGRRLYVAFERKRGKVEIINPGISSDLSEELLSLHWNKDNSQTQWRIYRGKVMPEQAAREVPVHQDSSLLELLGWCHFNGLIDSHASALRIQPPGCPLSQWELRYVVDVLQQLFPRGTPGHGDIQSLASQPRITRAGLFINLAHDPMEKLSRNGLQLVSGRIDPLSYGSRRENLATRFEMIAVSSWNEVLTFQYTGSSAWLDCLCDLFAWTPLGSGSEPPELPCFSFSSSRGPVIARRLEKLYSDIREFFFRSRWRRHGRYVLQLGRSFYVLQHENNCPRYTAASSHRELLELLGEAQPAFSRICLDADAFTGSALPVVVRHNRENIVQVFFQVLGSQARIYVLDERGSLFHQRSVFQDRSTLLSQFRQFLESVREHAHGSCSEETAGNTLELEYYQVIQNDRDEFSATKLDADRFCTRDNGIHLRLYSDALHPRSAFSLVCGTEEFVSRQYEGDVYERAARHLLEQNRSGEDCKPWLTGIDTGNGVYGLQTVDFLKHKKQVETQLNAALRRLGRATA